jgi:hypothetical protein
MQFFPKLLDYTLSQHSNWNRKIESALKSH